MATTPDAAARARLAPIDRFARSLGTFIGLVFLAAGAAKSFDIAEFRESLEPWSTMPWFTKDFVGLAVPPVEVVIGLMILLRLRVRLALVLGTVLLISFSSAIIVQLSRGEVVGCRCFGNMLMFREAQTAATWMLVRNAVLLAAAGLALWAMRDPTGAPAARPLPDSP